MGGGYSVNSLIGRGHEQTPETGQERPRPERGTALRLICPVLETLTNTTGARFPAVQVDAQSDCCCNPRPLPLFEIFLGLQKATADTAHRGICYEVPGDCCVVYCVLCIPALPFLLPLCCSRINALCLLSCSSHLTYPEHRLLCTLYASVI